jgi:hypothetical protein
VKKYEHHQPLRWQRLRLTAQAKANHAEETDQLEKTEP